MTIDVERLRRDLIDYFGTATGMFPVAMMELSQVQNASPEMLIEIARKNGFDLRDYAG